MRDSVEVETPQPMYCHAMYNRCMYYISNRSNYYIIRRVDLCFYVELDGIGIQARVTTVNPNNIETEDE